MEKLSTLAPGRLSTLLEQGLRGHHPLFEQDAIREAFAGGGFEHAVAREEAGDVGQALLAICRDSPEVARDAVEAMPAAARTSLIRLYFRLLDRAATEEAAAGAHH